MFRELLERVRLDENIFENMDLPTCEFSKIFEQIDTNHDKIIDRYELKYYLAINGIVSTDEQLEFLFLRLDVNGDD